jgi:hypothetical protein
VVICQLLPLRASGDKMETMAANMLKQIGVKALRMYSAYKERGPELQQFSTYAPA